MANHLALNPVTEHAELAQLKTRIKPSTKRALCLLALERGRPLQHEIEDALSANVNRELQELASRFAPADEAV